ncbi:imelysin family protein [Marinimicrobium sp. LS-A18]|uniref:imelysin family protein n=1 Tax=Marinimicrobium sp. LS-A18 TaxID=1381596 RepID=UPI0004639556|nr:imelysin family protein [Marinimicrobium sp. LS-A18]
MRINRAVLPLLALIVSGCVGDDQSSNAESESARNFDYQGMMANYADNVILPEYRNFAEEAEALAQGPGSVASYCDRLYNPEGMADVERVRDQWRRAMYRWQRVELFQVGPLAANGGALRNRIYSFGSSAPLSQCAVDQGVVLAQREDFDLMTRSVNARGLDALEYLLFSEDLNYHCPSQINETQGWNDLPEQTRREQRCDYAQRLADDIEAASQTLVEAWEPEGGDYRFEWVNPANQEVNLKALSDALFYIELETKDRKLGVPTGINASCSAAACPDAVESPFSESSMRNINANLDAFLVGFTGGNGLGFDDIFVQEGFARVRDEFEDTIIKATAGTDYSRPSLLEETRAQAQSGSDADCRNAAANPDVHVGSACAAHGFVKRVTDRLRTDFITIVNLDLPERGQSDND